MQTMNKNIPTLGNKSAQVQNPIDAAIAAVRFALARTFDLAGSVDKQLYGDVAEHLSAALKRLETAKQA